VKRICLALIACAGCGEDNASPADARIDAEADAQVDADPRTTIAPGSPFSIGPDDIARQDEDPAIAVDLQGSLYALWYSNRGSAAVGHIDKQVYAIKSTDGATWTPPVAISSGNDWAFAPSVTLTSGGGLVAAWWNWHNTPDGCTVSVDCTGTTNWLLARSSADGVAWTAPIEPVTTGLGDWLPSVVDDPANSRVLIYFAAVARRADGVGDVSDSRSRLFVTVKSGTTWGAVTPLVGVNDTVTHQSYPFVVRRPDGTFAMTWTRFAAADGSWSRVISEPSTETWVATSTDGITWTNPHAISETAGTYIDAFPTLHFDHAQAALSVIWVTTDGAPTGHVVEMPFEGAYPTGRSIRANLTGYTPRVLATSTPGVFWGVWVQGNDPNQRVRGQFFTK